TAPGEDAPPAKPAEHPASSTRGQAFLGIRVHDEDGHVAVRSLVPGSPAARAGFREGDRVTRLAHHDARSVAGLTGALRDLSPGRTGRAEVVGPDGPRVVDLCVEAAPRTSAEADHPFPAAETASNPGSDVDLEELFAELSSLRKEVAELRALLETAAQRRR